MSSRIPLSRQSPRPPQLFSPKAGWISLEMPLAARQRQPKIFVEDHLQGKCYYKIFHFPEERVMPMRKLKEETELFYSYLRQNGLKKTYQKDLILETFLSTEGHLSVEDIYALVKKRDRKVGVVTVFRTLKSLTACGIAREITLGDGLTRFEHSYHHPPHHHIVCTECHKAIEFVCPELERIQSEIIKQYHFKPIHHRFQTYGICEDCREHRPIEELQKHDTDRIFARDAAKMAISMENRCLEFYRDAAGRNQDCGGKEVFEHMVLEEEAHIADLNSKLEEIVQQEKDLERAPIFLHFDPCELEALIPSLTKHTTDGEFRLDARSAAEFALTLNRNSAEFFKAYAEKFSESQGKSILLNFADQEWSHGDRIQRRMEEMPAAVKAF
jgi:Fur family transcriptional regulator, ferric uptake regulator